MGCKGVFITRTCFRYGKPEDNFSCNGLYMKHYITGGIQTDWIGDKLRVRKDICMKFFEKALKSIGDHLADLLKRPECKGADTILMVGGFSESPLLQEFIKNK